MKSKIFSIIFGSCVCAALLLPALASADTGSITNSPAYAWGEYLGWLNFTTDEGDVVVTDSGLSGYVWSQTSGWLNLNPGGTFGGVTNDGDGNLGGFAWSSVYGPVSFAGISINEDGQFEGTSDGAGAGAVAGRITFDCDECDVITDWSADSSSGNSSSGGSSGGGGRRAVAPSSPLPAPLVPTTPPPIPSNPPVAPGLPSQPDQSLSGNSENIDSGNNGDNSVPADLASSDANTNSSGNKPGNRTSISSLLVPLLEPRALAVLGGAGVLILGYFVFRFGVRRG